MQKYDFRFNSKKTALALGAQSAGNFSLWKNGVVHFSQDFGDLDERQNFSAFQTALLKFLKDQKIRPTVILSDLHPHFHTTKLAQALAKKYRAEYLPIQHHFAHIFSAIGEKIVKRGASSVEREIPAAIFGIACDGTGLGTDEKIWGGEIFTITKKQKLKTKRISNSKLQITRIGHLENQILLGGEMAIRQPARMLISILSKFLKKNDVYKHVKKYYASNEFEVLWRQLEQNFNCLETSSAARVLDAVSVLLGFSGNERTGKHGPVALLEKNSTKPYNNLNPKIGRYNKQDTKTKQNSNFKIQASSEMLFLNTTYLFEYLIKNLHRDRSRLAATAQKYLADGLIEIIKNSNRSLATSNQTSAIGNQEKENPAKKKKIIVSCQLPVTDYRLPITDFLFAAGGITSNKIISEIMEKQGFYLNKKIPRGDAGISFGQIIFYLLANSGNQFPIGHFDRSQGTKFGPEKNPSV